MRSGSDWLRVLYWRRASLRTDRREKRSNVGRERSNLLLRLLLFDMESDDD